MRSADRLLPVFVQPAELVVVCSKPETHKQQLTLINPFDFTLHYKVLSNAPSTFVVHDSNGFVRPKCVVGISIRHRAPTQPDVGAGDVLRLEIFREGRSQICGRKDIPVKVVASEISRPFVEEFRSIPSSASSTSRRSTNSRPHAAFVHDERPSPNLFWFVTIACLVSIVAVFLPTFDENKPHSFVPAYLRPSHSLQLVAAYVLGLSTVYFIQQNN
ncbi:Major sperm protein [Aphelenchoides fujianensis]|nr:Major sperm protein [Aphelenchoides fujianensis]